VHQSEIILFDKGDPIIMIGTTTGEHNLSMQPFPEVQQMGVEALTRVIWVKFNTCKRQMLYDADQTIFHYQVTALQNCKTLAQASDYVTYLEGIYVLSRGTVSTVMHQTQLEIASL